MQNANETVDTDSSGQHHLRAEIYSIWYILACVYDHAERSAVCFEAIELCNLKMFKHN